MTAQSAIAIVSLACRLPDARSPTELWRNVLEGRRSFRPIPRERLDLARYAVQAVGEADSITDVCAGLLTNWSFDREHFRVPKRTFEATDLSHWLALELAEEAIARIGGLERLNRTRTAVIVANTLTGEFSRTSLLRLRAPFLDEVLADAADRTGLTPGQNETLRGNFLSELRDRFPEPNEDSLAGGLANTIAGRIANHFDLHGGAYTIDGACASSLVALADAANLLATDNVDAVILGAIDLSLDPFELVGFSRNGALAKEEMRVFDARSSGFWPGEGGGFSVLMRSADAHRRDLPVLASIRGWGLSTDGAGGLTRPSISGQLLAAERAYAMAEVDPSDLAYVEAHGTGTAVGDPIEVQALARLRENSRASLPIGSIKANIGHTKAAAGFAGLIKAVEVLRHGIVPPHVGCAIPHPVFEEVEQRVRPAIRAELIKSNRHLAGVSSFGFGGINAHVLLEATGTRTRRTLPTAAPSSHDMELFLFAGEREVVLQQMHQLSIRAASMSFSEMSEAAALLARTRGEGPLRAAVIASRQDELIDRLARAGLLINAGPSIPVAEEGVLIGTPTSIPRVGFVFPGQAAPSHPDGGIWQRCFKHAASLIQGRPGSRSDAVATEIAQPVIMAANLAALELMRRVGIKAEVAVGHSLGEIAALCWANALTEESALRFARRRGSIMARDARPGGGMLRVAMNAGRAGALAACTGLTIACENGVEDTVLAGPKAGIRSAAELCERSGSPAMRLSVSHAFHSEDMASAAPALNEALGEITWTPTERLVVSTITGKLLEGGADLREMLTRQLTDPVRFHAAMNEAALRADLFVEVGPGDGLSRLITERGSVCVAVDAFGASLCPLLVALAELHVRGCSLDLSPLFVERPIRSLEATAPSFLKSPCSSRRGSSAAPLPAGAPVQREVRTPMVASDGEPLDVILAVLAAETGLPFDRDKPLPNNSLDASRLVIAAARALGCRSPSTPTDFANKPAWMLAETLKELRDLKSASGMQSERIGGVRRWVRTYGIRWRPVAPPLLSSEPISWARASHRIQRPNLRQSLDEEGLLIWLEGDFDIPRAEWLVELVSEAARAGTPNLAICHENAPISGFARSVARERHFRSLRVIDRSGAVDTDPRIAAALAAAVDNYREMKLGTDGSYEEPTFVPVDPEVSELGPIGPGDVAVVIGGAKGISAECALQIGSRGAALILVGRSPADDEEVGNTLRRAAAAGVRCEYVQADVLDYEMLSARVLPALAEFGPPTVLVHASATNQPAGLLDISNDALRRTLLPKTEGLDNALRVLGPTLRLLIAFGSIIGRIGLDGEAHYALANAMQSAAAESWAREAPGRAALALEWSVWGGIGMGERLGTLDRLGAMGVDALPLDDALHAFDAVIRRSAIGTIAVTGRFGPPPELGLGASDLPSLRFIDEPKLHFPGVEIVVETVLSEGRDPYLQDHSLGAQVLLPGVIALEAMAQAATVLASGELKVISSVRFLRAIAFERGADMRIRIAALSTLSGAIEVVIFAEDDGFREACVCAIFSPGNKLAESLPVSASGHGFDAVPLYDCGLLFQSGRFRRIDRFERATSREVAARLTAPAATNWFGTFEPPRFILWDPGAADAAMHALQVAVPHRRVLPIGVERIEIATSAGEPVRITATERGAAEDTYIFDVRLEDSSGRVVQAWAGATFRAVGRIDPVAPVLGAPALIVPYLERMAREGLRDETVKAAFVMDAAASRSARRSTALGLLGVDDLDRRGDGRPVRTRSNGSVSIAHRDGVTLMVTATDEIGCDIEKVPVTAAAGTSIELRRHVAFESFRKLGRVLDPPKLPILSEEPILVDDVRLLVIELPTPFGPHLIGLGGAPARTGAPAHVPEELPA